MNYLLDTNVLSEVRRPAPDGQVLAWLDAVDEDRVFLSVISIAEIARGVHLLADSRRKAALEQWLESELVQRFDARLLPVDGATALIWGELLAFSKGAGIGLSVMDGWIAATARRHELTLVTRNIKDFANLGLPLLDPWNLPPS